MVAMDTKKTETAAKSTHWDSVMCVYLPSTPRRLSNFNRWSACSNRQDMNNNYLTCAEATQVAMIYCTINIVNSMWRVIQAYNGALCCVGGVYIYIGWDHQHSDRVR